MAPLLRMEPHVYAARMLVIIVCRAQQLRGWMVAVIGCLINVVELGTFKSFGVFIMPVRESLIGSYTAVGTAMAASHTICYLSGKSIIFAFPFVEL